MTVTDHPAVAAYLARLDALAAHLPPARRQELRADLLEHLAEAVPPGADDAAVRHALDRLGPPEDVVGAEESPAPAVPAAPARSTSLVHEGLAVAFLTAGSFVPVIGWLVGVALLWTSRRWTVREKLAGTLLVPGGPGVILLLVPLGAVSISSATICTTSVPSTVVDDGSQVTEVAVPQCTTSGTSGGPLLLVVVVLAFVLPFVVAGVLYRRASRRAAAEA